MIKTENQQTWERKCGEAKTYTRGRKLEKAWRLRENVRA